jgi:hypothetical protein
MKLEHITDGPVINISIDDRKLARSLSNDEVSLRVPNCATHPDADFFDSILFLLAITIFSVEMLRHLCIDIFLHQHKWVSR